MKRSEIRGRGGGADHPRHPHDAVRSPWFNARTWAAEYSADDAASCGNLSARNGGAVVTSFADGHTEARTPETLDDMRIWSNGATSKDWTLTPSGG